MDIPVLHMALPDLVRSVGYLGVFGIVVVESGVPLGAVLPLPGDTLLFTGGILAAAGAFDIVPLALIIFLGAVIGGSIGYWFGATFGPGLFKNESARVLNPRTLARVERFFDRYGNRALVLARFLPVFRTLVPVAAGIARMPYRRFLFGNVVGSLIWTALVTLLGYFLGRIIPNVDHYLLPIIGLLLAVSAFAAYREARIAQTV